MKDKSIQCKLGILLSIPVICLGLAACGNNNQGAKENSSLKAENASLKAQNSANYQSKARHVVQYSNSEYALAAFLKVAEQSADELQSHDDNMNWVQKDNNTFNVDFGAHTTQMRVDSDDVEVTYDDVEGDHMGQGNGHQTFTKEELNQDLKGSKKTIDAILADHGGRDTNQSGTETSSTASKSSDDSDYDLPLSDPRNPDGPKQAEMMSIAGDPQYRDSSGAMNESGRALESSIRATMHNGN